MNKFLQLQCGIFLVLYAMFHRHPCITVIQSCTDQFSIDCMLDEMPEGLFESSISRHEVDK